MNSTEFKKSFNEIAKVNGFKHAFGGWFKESEECIVILDLQKSNYSNLYYLNIKCYIQGMFGQTYILSKELVKSQLGNISSRQLPIYNNLFDLESKIDDLSRKIGLDSMFCNYLNIFSSMLLQKKHIKKIAEDILAYVPEPIIEALQLECNSQNSKTQR